MERVRERGKGREGEGDERRRRGLYDYKSTGALISCPLVGETDGLWCWSKDFRHENNYLFPSSHKVSALCCVTQ